MAIPLEALKDLPSGRVVGSRLSVDLPRGQLLFKLPFESSVLESDVLDLLRQRLPDYQRTELPLALPEAAVLMPLVDSPEPRVILTVRSSSMPTHAGEVAFPGGKRDPSDKNLLMTALRESEEEVGLSPDYVDVLGQLSPLASRYGMKVTPFVGIVHPDAQLQAEPGEIETIFQVPLRFFLDETPELSSPIDFFGRRFRIPSYYYEDKRIWGLTAFMILDLINHVYDAGIEFDVSHWPDEKDQ